MALTPLNTEADPLPSPSRPDEFEDDMDRLINTKLPLLAEEVDDVATAFTLNATNSTSSSSVTIGTGTKNYTVEASKSYVKGMFVIAADSSAPSTNYNYGQVLSYDSGTGALSIDVIDAAGSGTLTSWIVSQTASGGVTVSGATFTGDIIVPADAYDSGWNGDNSVPTKNDVYDEIVKTPTETTIGRVEKATAVEAAAFTADKYIDGARLKDAFNATGSAPFYACRAWVNFNGTRNVTDTGASTNGNPVLIRGSGNVTSVVKNATGDYTINFTTAMPDANYSLNVSASIDSIQNTGYHIGSSDKAPSLTTTSCDVFTKATSSTVYYDADYVTVSVFR